MNELRRGVAVPLGEDEVEFGVEPEKVPPVGPNVQFGKSKYPFGELKVGYPMKIKRPLPTIKSALRLWMKRHGGRYVARRDQPGWTKVWRLK